MKKKISLTGEVLRVLTQTYNFRGRKGLVSAVQIYNLIPHEKRDLCSLYKQRVLNEIRRAIEELGCVEEFILVTDQYTKATTLYRLNLASNSNPLEPTGSAEDERREYP
jgi:dihydrodipicolinate synthase/N-acetylneuraminate lyase